MLCHQLGNRIIRQIDNLDQFDSTLAAWDHRVKMGQRGSQMTNVMSRFGRERGLQMFADWSDRVAAGAVPPPDRRACTCSGSSEIQFPLDFCSTFA